MTAISKKFNGKSTTTRITNYGSKCQKGKIKMVMDK